jgi:hypothetical protein
MSATVIIKGTTRRPEFSVVDEDGDAIDMTVDGRRLLLRMTAVGASAPTLTRDTAVGAEVAWDDQAGGTGAWVIAFGATAALAVGRYKVEVYYFATATAEQHRVYGPVEWTVEAPATGAL